jgi:phosphate starvation-inducible PhoH-like protein
MPNKRQPSKSALVKGKKRVHDAIDPYQEQPDVRVTRIDRTPIVAKTANQKLYINAIKTAELTFATGSAGVGKTWLVGALAAEMLDSKKIEKIVLTRPAIEAGENLGFLPGELEEKFAPYLVPFMDVFHERLGKTFYEYCLKVGKIEAAPLAYMRGRTFKNALVILDEAQNTTPLQMKMFLTRIGEGCTVVVNGDLLQKDIPGASGLEDAINRLSFIPSVKVVRFSKGDSVRSGLVREIVEAYETEA